MIYNHEQKARKTITYSIAQALTHQDAVSAFNNCASCIKTSTYEELCDLIDGELA